MPSLTTILKDGFDAIHWHQTTEYEGGYSYESFHSEGPKRVLLRPGDMTGFNIGQLGQNDDAEWWVYTRASDGFGDDDQLTYHDEFHGASRWRLVEPQHSIGDDLVLWRAQEDDRDGERFIRAHPPTTTTDATATGGGA